MRNAECETRNVERGTRKEESISNFDFEFSIFDFEFSILNFELIGFIGFGRDDFKRDLAFFVDGQKPRLASVR